MTPGRRGGLARAPADARSRAGAPVDGHRTVSDRRRILLCDAESQSLHALRVVLHGAGFEVDATSTAAEALDRGALRQPTAAIIELVLPDGDGVEVCRRLREWSAMPVILLSAVCDEEAQVRAFAAGADDYVTKPFRPRELVARVLAKLRRAEPEVQEPCVQLDGLEIDLAARVVRREGEVVHLTPIEFKLLAVLVQNRGRLLSHNALLQQVWGAAYMDARQTLRAHIANLRRKIEPPDGERLIHNDPGVGYRLADVHPEGATRGRPAEELIDRDLVRSRVSASHALRPAGWARPAPHSYNRLPTVPLAPVTAIKSSPFDIATGAKTGPFALRAHLAEGILNRGSGRAPIVQTSAGAP
jgi:two-component system, OmpR family, KDP operon response regulator KdpE